MKDEQQGQSSKAAGRCAGLGSVCRAAGPSLLIPASGSVSPSCHCHRVTSVRNSQIQLGRLMDVAMLTASSVHSLAKHPSDIGWGIGQRLGNSPQSFQSLTCQ